MSDQSEEIIKIMTDMAKQASDDAMFDSHQVVMRKLMAESCDSWHESMDYQVSLARTQATKLFRNWAGHEPFENAHEAIVKTTASAKHFMMPVLHAAFADGVQLGHGVGHVIKKYRFFGEEGKLYELEDFRQESSLLMMSLLADYDTIEFFERHFDAGVTTLSESTGFELMEPEIANKKIWDFWNLVATGSTTHLFLAGQAYGKQMNEQEDLAAKDEGNATGEGGTTA